LTFQPEAGHFEQLKKIFLSPALTGAHYWLALGAVGVLLALRIVLPRALSHWWVPRSRG